MSFYRKTSKSKPTFHHISIQASGFTNLHQVEHEVNFKEIQVKLQKEGWKLDTM